MVQRKLQQSQRATDIAKQNLINAQNALKEAENVLQITQKQLTEKQQNKKKVSYQLDKSKSNLNIVRDKVRSKLYNYESKYIDTITKLLRKDIIQLELSSKRLIKEANQIKKKKEQQQKKQQLKKKKKK